MRLTTTVFLPGAELLLHLFQAFSVSCEQSPEGGELQRAGWGWAGSRGTGWSGFPLPGGLSAWAGEPTDFSQKLLSSRPPWWILLLFWPYSLRVSNVSIISSIRLDFQTRGRHIEIGFYHSVQRVTPVNELLHQEYLRVDIITQTVRL